LRLSRFWKISLHFYVYFYYGDPITVPGIGRFLCDPGKGIPHALHSCIYTRHLVFSLMSMTPADQCFVGVNDDSEIFLSGVNDVNDFSDQFFTRINDNGDNLCWCQ
jgi:hypothetical protein